MVQNNLYSSPPGSHLNPPTPHMEQALVEQALVEQAMLEQAQVLPPPGLEEGQVLPPPGLEEGQVLAPGLEEAQAPPPRASASWNLHQPTYKYEKSPQ
jgi:hypothetical protein